MAQSIEQARQEVQSALTSTLAWADTSERRSFAAFESRRWTLMLTLGRALVRLFLLVKPRDRGSWSIGRAVGPTGRRQASQSLGDAVRQGGVCPARGSAGWGSARSSGSARGPRVVSVLGFLPGRRDGRHAPGGEMAFGVARETYREIYEWAPSPRAVLRMVDAVGARARGFLEQAAVPADDGALLFMQGDGRGAPMIGQAEHERRRQPHTAPTAGATTRTRRRRRRKERPRVRRTTGKKSKNPRSRSLGVSIRFSQRPRALRARSTRGSTQRSRATWRSSSGCAARQTNAATARSGRSFWAMAASTSGDSSRSTSLRLRRASTGIT